MNDEDENCNVGAGATKAKYTREQAEKRARFLEWARKIGPTPTGMLACNPTKEMLKQMMLRVLVVDDDKNRQAGFQRMLASSGRQSAHAFTSKEARAMMQAEKFDVAFLDHDLGEFVTVGGRKQEITGKNVVEFLISLPVEQRPNRVVVHSTNPPGADTMVEMLQEAGVSVRKVSVMELLS